MNEFTIEDKKYVTVEATNCDKCEFFWRDGGIYDACIHPDQTLVKNLCGADNRLRGINLSWIKQ